MPTLPSEPQRRARYRALALPFCLLALLAFAASAAQAATLEKGFWGPTVLNGKSAFTIYQQLGLTLYNTPLYWSAVAPTRPANPTDPNDPAYRWQPELDATINEAASHHMRVMLMLTRTPAWANGDQTDEYAPDNPADFAAFARAAARRYPSVRRWMIWGEPSRSTNWKPFVEQPLGAPLTSAEAVAPRRYARLLDAAYGQLKAERKSNIVIGGNTYVTGDVRPGDWLRSLKLPNGRPPRMDEYGHNPFSFRKPDLANPPSSQGLVDFSDLGRFDKLVQRYVGRPRHKRVPLFLSEFTVPTALDNEFNFHVSEKLQAAWITAALRIGGCWAT